MADPTPLFPVSGTNLDNLKGGLREQVRGARPGEQEIVYTPRLASTERDFRIPGDYFRVVELPSNLPYVNISFGESRAGFYQRYHTGEGYQTPGSSMETIRVQPPFTDWGAGDIKIVWGTAGIAGGRSRIVAPETLSRMPAGPVGAQWPSMDARWVPFSRENAVTAANLNAGNNVAAAFIPANAYYFVTYAEICGVAEFTPGAPLRADYKLGLRATGTPANTTIAQSFIVGGLTNTLIDPTLIRWTYSPNVPAGSQDDDVLYGPFATGRDFGIERTGDATLLATFTGRALIQGYYAL